ncbi:MAG TPA: CopG family transcriptional regulator [Myxococcota bacterium]|nr:CopG family transcriptional regulator [Myxococcota bacterium]
MEKSDVITFKVDGELKDALNRMKNRSEFIRSALMAALDGTCPLCHGSGTLTPRQMTHWQRFSMAHHISECGECHGIVIECGDANDDESCIGGHP